MLAIILALAGSSLIILLVFKRLASRSASNCALETVTTFSILKNKGQLRTYLNNRILGSKARFIKLGMPGVPTIVIKNPEDAKIILSQPEQFTKSAPPFTQILTDLLTPSIVSSNGQEWRRFRDVLSHPFHFDQVKGWVNDFDQLGDQLLDIWTEKHSNQPLEVTSWLARFTIDILGRTVFSTDFGAMQGKKDQISQYLGEIVRRVANPSELLAGAVERLTGFNVAFATKRRCNEVRDIFQAMIDERKQILQSAGPNHVPSIIDVMIQSNANLTPNELITNVLVIFIAGFDTTATALSFLMYYLGQNPDIQQRAREEINTVLKGQKITSGDLRSLPYLTAVIKEGMRIQPPVGLIPTRAAETDVDYGGITFTKGTQVWLSVYGLHHNPELWPNPNRFDPDRFYVKSEENTKRHPFAYMPFSMKSRACLGNQFSLVEQTVFMCSLLSRFQWTSLELEPTSDPVISKPNRVVVDLKPITNQSSPSIL